MASLPVFKNCTDSAAGTLMTNQLGQTAFLNRRAGTVETGVGLQAANYGVSYVRIIVSEEVRGKDGVIVDITIPIGIPQVGSPAADKVDAPVGSHCLQIQPLREYTAGCCAGLSEFGYC